MSKSGHIRHKVVYNSAFKDVCQDNYNNIFEGKEQVWYQRYFTNIKKTHDWYVSWGML